MGPANETAPIDIPVDQREEECDRLLAGRHPAAIAKLLERYHRPLYSFLYHRIGDAAAAEDLLQELLVRVWRNRDRYEARGRLSAWLFTIARRLASDELAKRSARRTQPLEDALEDAPAPAEPLPGPEAQAAAGEGRGRIEAAIAALPGEQREAFLLREYGGLSFAEIAEAQGCPLGTALARMRYAVLKLRKALEDLDA